MEQVYEFSKNMQHKYERFRRFVAAGPYEFRYLEYGFVLGAITLISLLVFTIHVFFSIKSKNTKKSILSAETTLITLLSFIKLFQCLTFLKRCRGSGYNGSFSYTWAVKPIADSIIIFSCLFIIVYFVIIWKVKSILKRMKANTTHSAADDESIRSKFSKMMYPGALLALFLIFTVTYKIFISKATQLYDGQPSNNTRLPDLQEFFFLLYDDTRVSNIQSAAAFLFLASCVEFLVACYYSYILSKSFTEMSTIKNSVSANNETTEKINFFSGRKTIN